MTALAVLGAAVAVGVVVALTVGRSMLRAVRATTSLPGGDGVFLTLVVLESVLADVADRTTLLLTFRDAGGNRSALVVRGDICGYAARRLSSWCRSGAPISARMLADRATVDLQPPGRLPGLFLPCRADPLAGTHTAD